MLAGLSSNIAKLVCPELHLCIPARCFISFNGRQRPGLFLHLPAHCNGDAEEFQD